jgi:hypothetical protein
MPFDCDVCMQIHIHAAEWVKKRQRREFCLFSTTFIFSLKRHQNAFGQLCVLYYLILNKQNC